MSFDPLSIFGLIPGIGDLIQGQQNLKMQKEQYSYQKELNEKIMQREDSAIQRRTSDMQKAGFTKWGALGSPASSTAVSSAPAPQSNIDFSGLLNALSGFMNARTQAKAQKADERLKNQEIINMRDDLKTSSVNRDKAVSETNLNDKQREHLDQQLKELKDNFRFHDETKISQRELEYLRDISVDVGYLTELTAGTGGALKALVGEATASQNVNVNGKVNVASLIVYLWQYKRAGQALFNQVREKILNPILSRIRK